MIYSQLFQIFNHSSVLLRAVSALILVVLLGSSVFNTSAVAQEPSGVAHQVSININTADAKSLAAALKGIGPSRADDIVRYRETYGPFASIEELAEVKGVGKSTIERNRTILTLE